MEWIEDGFEWIEDGFGWIPTTSGPITWLEIVGGGGSKWFGGGTGRSCRLVP